MVWKLVAVMPFTEVVVLFMYRRQQIMYKVSRVHSSGSLGVEYAASFVAYSGQLYML